MKNNFYLIILNNYRSCLPINKWSIKSPETFVQRVKMFTMSLISSEKVCNEDAISDVGLSYKTVKLHRHLQPACFFSYETSFAHIMLAPSSYNLIHTLDKKGQDCQLLSGSVAAELSKYKVLRKTAYQTVMGEAQESEYFGDNVGQTI